MQKVDVRGGMIVNIIEVDPNAIPDWCADWPDWRPQDAIGWPYIEDAPADPDVSASVTSSDDPSVL